VCFVHFEIWVFNRTKKTPGGALPRFFVHPLQPLHNPVGSNFGDSFSFLVPNHSKAFSLCWENFRGTTTSPTIFMAETGTVQ
jgi:hypothetical protein